MTTTNALILAAYLFPAIFAWVRSHPSADSIAVVNLLLGWTFIGWVVALAWAVNTPRRAV